MYHMKRFMRKKVTKEDLGTKVGKYLVARNKGLNKAQSARVAGYTENDALHNTNKIEKTQLYQALEQKFFKDELEAQITLKEIGAILVRNMVQDVNLSASNAAVQIALDKLEPTTQEEKDEQVLVILK